MAEENPEISPLLDYAAVIRRLRVECAWKRSQTHRSLQRYLLEECYETIEAIDQGESTGDWSALREELGDLLLQIYFHSVIAEELGEFSLDEVAADAAAKMRRRNPHVFGEMSDASQLNAQDIDANWQQIKSAEKQRSGLMEGVPLELPALLYALKVTERLTSADQLIPAPADDLGGRLLALVDEAHALGIDPEQTLRDAARRRASTVLD